MEYLSMLFRDSGYGMLKKVDSEKCSQVGVIPG